MIGTTLSRLVRRRLSLMNGVMAVAGALLVPGEPAWRALAALFVAVSLLAAGSSALNQLLERHIDPLMARTKGRPLPKGELTPRGVAAIGAACLAVGLALLAETGTQVSLCLGAGTVLWYLGVYTPMKRRSRLSLLLGALCGATPPLIGWSAFGGALPAFPPLLLASLLYLWQIPHFILLQRRHAEEFKAAGILLFDLSRYGRHESVILMLWGGAALAAAAMFPLFGLVPLDRAHYLAPFLLLALAGRGRVGASHSTPRFNRLPSPMPATLRLD